MLNALKTENAGEADLVQVQYVHNQRVNTHVRFRLSFIFIQYDSSGPKNTFKPLLFFHY